MLGSYNQLISWTVTVNKKTRRWETLPNQESFQLLTTWLKLCSLLNTIHLKACFTFTGEIAVRCSKLNIRFNFVQVQLLGPPRLIIPNLFFLHLNTFTKKKKKPPRVSTIYLRKEHIEKWKIKLNSKCVTYFQNLYFYFCSILYDFYHILFLEMWFLRKMQNTLDDSSNWKLGVDSNNLSLGSWYNQK